VLKSAPHNIPEVVAEGISIRAWFAASSIASWRLDLHQFHSERLHAAQSARESLRWWAQEPIFDSAIPDPPSLVLVDRRDATPASNYESSSGGEAEELSSDDEDLRPSKSQELLELTRSNGPSQINEVLGYKTSRIYRSPIAPSKSRAQGCEGEGAKSQAQKNSTVTRSNHPHQKRERKKNAKKRSSEKKPIEQGRKSD